MLGRPRKNTALWYKHDNNMRKDNRIIDLRRRYGLEGYAIYNMLIEVLIDTDFYAYEYTEHSAEELSKDFGIDKNRLIEIINYCINDKLFFIKDGFLRNKTLEDRLVALDMKRNRDRKKVQQVELNIEPVSRDTELLNKLNEAFTLFWETYPSKRRREKEKCRLKFIQKCRKSQNPELESSRAVKSLVKYLGSDDFEKDDYLYVQLSITWINKWDLDTWLSVKEEKQMPYKELKA